MIDFLFNYWWVIIIGIAIIGVGGYLIYVFIKSPTNIQLEKIQEWLLYAVAKAEKELGGGTGELKLRYVYDLFIHTFPSLSKAISFDSFSFLVDTALEKLNFLLEHKTSIQEYIQQD